MTHLIDILTALVLCISVIGGGIRAVAQITRLADSVDRMSRTMEGLSEAVHGIDTRVGKLEAVNIVKAARPGSARSRD